MSANARVGRAATNTADDRSAAGLIDAVKANWAELYTFLGRSPAAELSTGPHLSWLLTGVPDPFLNAVFRTDVPLDRAMAIVEEALGHFLSSNVTRLSWWADMSGVDAGPHLMQLGLIPGDDGTAMAGNLRSIPELPDPSGLEIRHVGDPASLRSWVKVMSIGFGMPESAESRLIELFEPLTFEFPMASYLGLLDGRPVATSQLFVGAGVAGVYSVTCLPDARGRGVGGAMTRAAMLDGRAHGCELSVLQASDLGYPVYRRLGFQDLGRIATYLYSSDDPFATQAPDEKDSGGSGH